MFFFPNSLNLPYNNPHRTKSLPKYKLLWSRFSQIGLYKTKFWAHKWNHFIFCQLLWPPPPPLPIKFLLIATREIVGAKTLKCSIDRLFLLPSTFPTNLSIFICSQQPNEPPMDRWSVGLLELSTECRIQSSNRQLDWRTSHSHMSLIAKLFG